MARTAPTAREHSAIHANLAGMNERLVHSFADDPILRRLKAELQRMYGNRIERVVLFGSRARGDARADSDYDVAVFLKDLPDPWRERFRLADLRVDFLDETGAFIEAQPFLATAYADRTPLMHAIRNEGLEL